MESNAANTAAFLSAAERTLLLIWQNPSTREFVRVGRFSQMPNGKYAFFYESAASSLSDFYPLVEFPDLDDLYLSSGLPAFFANRVMSQDRENYGSYRTWLGLEPGMDTPFEILARTGGGRATDTFHVVDAPAEGGQFLSRFFVSGISHVEHAQSRLERISVGDALEIRPQPENPVDPQALLVDVSTGEEVGWVPSWLLAEVHHQIDDGRQIRMAVERVNLDAPDHLKLLARIEVA